MNRRRMWEMSSGAKAPPWYIAGGVAKANCLAAYQPKGAASLVASYTNLANPGTNDASAGTAPAFDTATGWTFDGTKYLVSSVPMGSKPISGVARIIPGSVAASQAVFGCAGTTGGAVEYRINATSKMSLLKANVALIGTTAGTVSVGTSVVIGFTYSGAGEFIFYFNGVGEAPGTNNQTFTAQTMMIGAVLNAANEKYTGSIQAMAVYDTVLTPAQMSAISTAMATLP